MLIRAVEFGTSECAVENSRAALAETLDAYRGAEARQATEVTKVLTMLGRGLAEAARAPAQLIGAVFEISTKPLRTVASSVTARRRPRPMYSADRVPAD